MAIPPRSVRDATRFTSTVPHAAMSSSSASYAASPSSATTTNSSAPPSRFQTPSRSGAPPPRRPGAGVGLPGGGLPPRSSSVGTGSTGAETLAGETPEQKVARLRAAHHAAKNAQVSQLDRVIAGSRRLFDSAHRFTIIGLISFTAIAGVLTAYTAADMMRYNKQRKIEFLAAQQQMDDDSLEAARLAFMRGDASPAQTALVEAARAAQKEQQQHQQQGHDSEFFKVPSLLGAPTPTTEASSEGSTPGASPPQHASQHSEDAAAAAGLRQSDLVRSVEDKARSALERERANQRNGGPLDRIGLEGQQGVAGGGKSWWKFW